MLAPVPAESALRDTAASPGPTLTRSSRALLASGMAVQRNLNVSRPRVALRTCTLTVPAASLYAPVPQTSRN